MRRAGGLGRAGDRLTSTERVVGPDGRPLVVKTRRDAPPEFFEVEAEGLRWLAEPGAVPVPEVVSVEPGRIVLEWIEPGRVTEISYENGKLKSRREYKSP